MAHIRNLSSRAYISNSLKESLGRFEMYRYSFIYAPTGYGKSKVCKTFFKNYSGYTVLWIDANSSPDIFWENFCNAIKILNPSFAASFKKTGFPDSEEDVNTVINLLSIMNSDKSSALLIIDNFDNIMDDNLSKIFASAYSSTAIGFKYIFILRKITSQNIINLISKDEALGISKKELAFSLEDIEDYFRLNEVVLDKETAKIIYEKTLGWPYIVHLCMEAHKNGLTDFVTDKCNTFIENNIWLESDQSEREFLSSMGVFSSFTLSQCIKQTLLSEKECLDMLNTIAFIDYNEHTRRYSFNPMFKKFIVQILKEKPTEEVRNITLRAARTNLDDGNYFEAMKLFSQSKEYNEIYKCTCDFVHIYPFIIKQNKEVFTDIANHYWDVEKNGQYTFSIMICFSMLLFNEKHMVETLLSDIGNDINNDSILNESQKILYLAELQYIKAYTGYNDFNKMREAFNIIPTLSKSPVNIIANGFPFNFECPSVMMLYHRQAGALDEEINALEKCAPDYYRITNGHGKGFEAVMKADALYNRGDFDSAEILCQKTIYMADSRNQYGIYIAACYILANISLYRGLNDQYKENMNKIEQAARKDDNKTCSLVKLADICNACMLSDIEHQDEIAAWLKDQKKIEDTVSFYSLSFVNVLFGKYLILNGEYHHFLGISGQLLGLNNLFSYVLPQIYTYIYLAVANQETGETSKAHKFLLEAIKLAEPDSIYMPFVHNYSTISDLMAETVVSRDFSSFIKHVVKISKNYEKGIKSIKKAGHILADYGLTVREADVAKLAAQRLSNKEIASQLFIAESTVKSNMKVIFNKLQINSRAELKNFFE